MSLAHLLRRLRHGDANQSAGKRIAGGLERGNQRRSAGEQSGQSPRELRHLKLDPRVADYRQPQFYPVKRFPAFLAARPQEHSHGRGQDQADPRQQIQPVPDREGDQQPRRTRQRDIQLVVQLSELGNHHRYQVAHNDRRKGDQQRRIDQRK